MRINQNKIRGNYFSHQDNDIALYQSESHVKLFIKCFLTAKENDTCLPQPTF